MEDIEIFAKVLTILSSAKYSLNYYDYAKIWGKDLGEHIWRQEGNDLLRIWRSGLTHPQKEQFVNFLILNEARFLNY